MRRSKRLVYLVCLVAAGPAICGRAEAQTAAHLRMQKVCKEFAAKTGHEVIGLGSWILGKAYKVGVSDHDLRLRVPPGTPDGQAAKMWKDSRNTFRTMIQREFGDKADDILRNTNLYPPSQLIGRVEDSTDAAKLFHRLQAAPTLSQTGPMSQKTARKFSEGLWGKGSKAWTQHYEATKGRLFYSHGGKSYSGMADLAHMAEGQAKFTAGGMANTTMGWVEHAAEEVAQKKPQRVAKYLERIDRDLVKARELAKTGADDAFRKQLRSLIDDLNAPGASVAAQQARINALLRRSSLESAILKRFDDAGPVQRELLDAMVKGIRGKEKLGKMLRKAAEKIPVEKLVNGLVMGLVAYNAGQTAGQRSFAEALVKTVPELASLPAGLLVEMTDACLEDAKLAGASLAASQQEAWDLVAGLHSARGREKVFERTATMEYSLDDLVKHVHVERKLSAFVYARADQAADRGGKALGMGDTKVRDAIFQRCYPTILRAWRAKRSEYRKEYILLVNKLRNTRVAMSYSPNPAVMLADGKRLAITLAVALPDTDLGEVLPRMRELLRLLGGNGTYAQMEIEFTGTGKSRESRSQMRKVVWAGKPGKYSTGVSVRFACGRAGGLGENEFLKLDLLRKARVDIEVKSAVAMSGRFAGTFRGKQNTGMIAFTITDTKVTGTVTAYDIKARMTGTYDPATKRIKAKAAGAQNLDDGHGKVLSTVRMQATITGTYAGGKFTGRYSGVSGGRTETGTWTASGKFVEPPAPRK